MGGRVKALVDRLLRMADDPLRLVRPADIQEVQAVRRWLKEHPDGGWLQCDDQDRVDTARRLLFVLWLRERGELSDDTTTR